MTSSHRAAARSSGRRFARAHAKILLPLVVSLCACGSDDAEPGDDGVAGSGGSEVGNPLGGSGGTAGSGAGGSVSAGTGGDGAAGTGGSPATPGVGECNVSTVDSPPTSAAHLVQCSATTYSTNPPSGGPHYAIWPAFQSYDFALPAGFVVHALEHGAVVFWYNCPEGCADEVAEVEALIAALPEDPLCGGTSALRRAVLLPYPELGSRWGMSAWGHALTADCVDAAAFEAFYTDHYAQGPEQLCNAGQAYTESPCP